MLLTINRDVLSGDEMFSDAYKITEIDDVIYEVDCSMITIKEGADIDIGANPSAEDAPEELEEGSQTVNNVVYSFRLVPTNYDKKSYLTHLKSYMKKVKEYLQEKNPERVEAFEKGAQAYAKKQIAAFNDLEFYTGESMDINGMVATLNYREDGVTPFLSFWKDGLVEVKL